MSRIFSTVYNDGSREMINLDKVSRITIHRNTPTTLTFYMSHEKSGFFEGCDTKKHEINYNDEKEDIRQYEEIKEQMK